MRVLVTGLGTFWGSHLAERLESIPDVEMIVGVDTEPPILPLERTEFVRADSNYSILDRIVRATQVDTILHTHLIVDSTELPGRALHEINVIGTMNLLAAAGAAGSPVRKVIVKSSALTYGANYQDPYFFRETMNRTRPPRTRVERSLLESASFVRDFAIDNPHVTVSKLRFTNVLGDDVTTPFSKALRLPLAPEVLGFDPRLQFTHESDVTGALVFATLNDVPGVFNIAGDGSLPWSEVCAIVGRRRFVLPPLLTQWAAEPLRIARILDLPPEVLSLLRYGRALDNSAFKRTGFRYLFSTAGTVDAFARSLRLETAVGSNRPAYKYERDVETFFRHSPAVVRERNERAVPLHLDRQGRVAILTLDEPERRNALTASLVADIVAAMDELDGDEGVGAVVVTGAPPAFCSGADVAALAAMAAGTEEPADVRDIYAGFLRVLDSPLPTVAAVNGPAVGAGCNLALACDVRVAGTSAVFDARFLRIGIHPGGGHTWLLDRAAGPQTTAAMDLFGERIDGPRAAAVGLAWECVADDVLLDRAVALATRAAEVPRELAIRTKATIRHTPTLAAHEAAMRFELEHQVWSLRADLGPAGGTTRR